MCDFRLRFWPGRNRAGGGWRRCSWRVPADRGENPHARGPASSPVVGVRRDDRSLRSTTVQPQVEGFVRQILVRAGDRVRAGQPLVQIDPDRQQATVTPRSRSAPRARPISRCAKQQLDAHAASCTRRAPSAAPSSTRRKPRTRTPRRSSPRCSRRSARAQVELQYYRVTAPTAGIVGDIPIRQGDRVTPATLITTIDQPEGLEAYVNVPLERATDLATGPDRGAARQRRRGDRLEPDHASSRRAPTMRRSRCWSRRRCARCRRDCG